MPNQSGFQPLSPEQLQGPYSGMLQPPGPQQAGPPITTGVGKAAGIAKIATEFLSGASRGRIRKFTMEQDEKLKNIALLGQYVQSIQNDPNLTPEAKSYAQKKYYESLGVGMQGELDGQGGGKGKGKKKGGEDQQQPDAMGATTHFLRGLATMFTGGQMPKGAPDVNPKELISNIFGEISQPQYNKQGIITENLSSIQSALKALPPGSTQEDALRATTQYFQNIERVDPGRAKSIRTDFLSQYQPGPGIGTPQYYMEQGMREIGKGGPPAQQPPTPGAPTPAGGVPPPQPPAGATPDEATSAPPLTQKALASFKLAKSVQEKNVVFTDQQGKKVGPVLGYEVTTPAGVHWYALDKQGKPTPISGSNLHEVGMAQQAETKPSPVVAAPDGAKDAYGKPLRPGQAVWFGRVGEYEGFFPVVHKSLTPGPDIKGSLAPPGSTDAWGRPLNTDGLYTTYLDEDRVPRTYLPKAEAAKYMPGVDDEGKPYAIPVPTYRGGGGGGTPPPTPPGETKPGEPKPAPQPKQTAIQVKAQENAGGAPNPYRAAGAAPPATPKKEQPKETGMPRGSIPLGSAKGVKLSALGTRALGLIDADLKMIEELKELLEQKDAKGRPYKDSGAGSLWERMGSKLHRLSIWGQYRAGMASARDTSALDRATAFIALDQILGGLPYMQGRFNMKYLEQVQHHIPDPTDTPYMMHEKTLWMLKNLPIIKQSIIDAETAKNVGGKVIMDGTVVSGTGQQGSTEVQGQKAPNPYR